VSEEFRKELEKLIKDIKSRVDALADEVEDLYESGEYYRAFRKWSEGVSRVLRDVRGSLSKLSELVKESKISEGEVKESIDYLKKSLEEILERVDEVNEMLRERGRRSFKMFVGVGPHRFTREIFKGLEDTLEGVAEGVERAIEAFEESLTKPTQVISVRLKEKDLEVIDRLVDAGIFKSRSEAIAYFTRKGIESSKEWIEKALEQAKKIKELQDSIRKELREHSEERENKEKQE
jgi:Arc/MetJ-type ribon-helix-helix transcriptional regulator